MISFTFVGGKRNLKPENIIYVQTDGHRNVFYVLEGEGQHHYRLYQKLDAIQQMLLPHGFVRCHRSCLVNLRYVTKVSNYLMELSTGEILTIPRSRYADVREAYSRFKIKNSSSARSFPESGAALTDR